MYSLYPKLSVVFGFHVASLTRFVEYVQYLYLQINLLKN